MDEEVDGGERPRYGLRDENRDSEQPDGNLSALDTSFFQRGQSDKQVFNSIEYQRRTKQKVVTDFTSVSKAASVAVKHRAALKSVLFNDKTPPTEEWTQMEDLKRALQAFAVPVNLKWTWRDEDQGSRLEASWTDVVTSHPTMSKSERHQQEALWEWLCTELSYINQLIVIRDLVMAALVNLHRCGFLLEVTPDLLFSNIPSILATHQLFWREEIYPMLQVVRTSGRPFDPLWLEAGILQFCKRFSSYRLYCWEEERNLEFAHRQMESNPHFLTYVQWVETHPQCERMRLGEMQAKPHQRITKYPLLLKAVMKNTQDPQTQQRLRLMLSSVNGFLESINDFLRLKDEELALSISAQRLEGYEVEGVNEEIDKHVRDIFKFDLTCPVPGTGPGVVRKLLLEANLKIRCRKDSKLEVVALLFSDVLLMTKVQKKGERLKVIRPPLALDRTSCIALKDNSSFLLVEVGELCCAVNVYVFTAGTSETCSNWVSTIQQAKKTLRNLREMERERQPENKKVPQTEERPVVYDNMADMEAVKESPNQYEKESFVDEDLIVARSVNGILVPLEQEDPDEEAIDDMSFMQSESVVNQKKLSPKKVTRSRRDSKEYEWIEMGLRQKQIYKEEEKFIAVMKKERNMTAPNIAEDAIEPRGFSGKHCIVPGGYPDVDYPTDELSSSDLPTPTTISEERPEILGRQVEGGTYVRKDSLSLYQGDPACHQTEGETPGFSRKLLSPRVRKRRQPLTHQSPSIQAPEQSLQSSRRGSSVSSNSDSDYSMNTKRTSLSSQSSGSHLVLKLCSLKSNQGMFWETSSSSLDPQTFSEPDLPKSNAHGKSPQMKSQRSASIPNIIIQTEDFVSSSNTHPKLQGVSANLPTLDRSRRCTSSVEGVLERAKIREQDHNPLTPDWNPKRELPLHPPCPLFSMTSSPSPSEDGEHEVQLLRHRALSVSSGWKEQLVDGDEDDNDNSMLATDGVNVDWPGWCFDDNELLDRLQLDGRGLLEDIGDSLTHWGGRGFLEQEDGECSQV